MFDLLVIAVVCLAYAKVKRTIVAKQRWTEANAHERERIVKDECAWRVIGRVMAAAGLGIGAFTIASPGLAVMWTLVAWRVVKPIKAEMREAGKFRSSGASDEPPYLW